MGWGQFKNRLQQVRVRLKVPQILWNYKHVILVFDKKGGHIEM